MHALLFQSHLSIAIMSKFTLWSLLLYTWNTYKIHLANQINHAGNTLLTDSHKNIPCLGQGI